MCRCPEIAMCCARSSARLLAGAISTGVCFVQEIARAESERRLNASRMADASSHFGIDIPLETHAQRRTRTHAKTIFVARKRPDYLRHLSCLRNDQSRAAIAADIVHAQACHISAWIDIASSLSTAPNPAMCNTVAFPWTSASRAIPQRIGLAGLG